MEAEGLNPRIRKVLRMKLTTIDLILNWNDVKTSRTTIWTLSADADGHAIAIVDLTEFDEVVSSESEARDLKVFVNNLAMEVRDAMNGVGDAYIEDDVAAI